MCRSLPHQIIESDTERSSASALIQYSHADAVKITTLGGFRVTKLEHVGRVLKSEHLIFISKMSDGDFETFTLTVTYVYNSHSESIGTNLWFLKEY